MCDLPSPPARHSSLFDTMNLRAVTDARSNRFLVSRYHREVRTTR